MDEFHKIKCSNCGRSILINYIDDKPHLCYKCIAADDLNDIKPIRGFVHKQGDKNGKRKTTKK